MKKLLVMVLVICMMPTFAFACDYENPAIVAIEKSTNACSGYAYFALDESMHIFAKLNETERVTVYSSKGGESTYIRGIVGNGIIRAKGEMRYLNVGGMLCGLTKVKCSVNIQEEYKEAVWQIIERRIENGAELTANAVIACTQWRTEETIYHIMFSSNVAHVSVGTLTVNECVTDICIGDFNGDGLFELGFPSGYWIEESKPEPEVEEEPEPAPEPVVIVNNYYVTEKTTQNVCNKVTNTIIQDNRQVNINSQVTNNQKQIVTINPNKDCGKQFHCVCY